MTTQKPKQLDIVNNLYKLDLKGNTYSQSGEEIYIEELLKHLGEFNKFVVDLGAQGNKELSNSRMFMDKYGYSHILMDYDTRDNPNVHKEFITAENVCELLKKYNCPQEFTFLSIDLDGNDYDILKAVCSQYSPRLVVFEFNGVFPISVSKKIKYNAAHRHLHNDYYGFTLGAGLKLAEQLGYRVIFQNNALNGYMVRKDLLADPEQQMTLGFEPKHSTYSSEGEWETVI
jgi:hypothetical protein